jgi:hypothetical protein
MEFIHNPPRPPYLRGEPIIIPFAKGGSHHLPPLIRRKPHHLPPLIRGIEGVMVRSEVETFPPLLRVRGGRGSYEILAE